MLREVLAAAAAVSVLFAPALAGGYGDKGGKQAVAADIVDVAVAAGEFKTLAAALQAADLVETLKGKGPFTVFAPTDAAFAKLPAGTVETLLKPENKAKLVSLLAYHVVPGKTKAAALAGKTTTVATVGGAALTIDGTNGVVVGGATVTKADIPASNGVIHVVDTVLTPPAQ